MVKRTNLSSKQLTESHQTNPNVNQQGVVVSRDGYYIIQVKWKSGFTHKVPCRGYGLKSEMAFNDSLFWVESHFFYEITQQEYEEYAWAQSLAVDIEKTTKKTTTRSPRKNGKSVPKDGAKLSRTKQSVRPATKSVKNKAASAEPTKKRSSGSIATQNK